MEQVIETSFGRINRVFYNNNTKRIGKSLSEVYAGEEIDRTALKWFYTIGYIPSDLTLFQNIYCLSGGAKYSLKDGRLSIQDIRTYDSLINTDQTQLTDEKIILKNATVLFHQIIDRYLSDGGECSTMYLTAGIDSRAILFSLLRHYQGKEINTITFGYRGSYDIEIARKLAKKYKLNHHEILLDNYELTIDHLNEFIDLSDGLVNVFQQPPHRECIDFIKLYGGKVWTGVGGGASMGSNLPLNNEWENPVLSLIKQDSSRVGGLFMGAGSIIDDYPNMEDVKKLMQWNTSFDSVDFENHHEKLVGPTILFRDLENICPFLDPHWLGYWLGLQKKFRLNRNLARKFVINLDKNSLKIASSLASPSKSGIKNYLLKYLRSRKYPMGKSKLLSSEFFGGYLPTSHLENFKNIGIISTDIKFDELSDLIIESIFSIYYVYKKFNANS